MGFKVLQDKVSFSFVQAFETCDFAHIEGAWQEDRFSAGMNRTPLAQKQDEPSLGRADRACKWKLTLLMSEKGHRFTL